MKRVPFGYFKRCEEFNLSKQLLDSLYVFICPYMIYSPSLNMI